MEVLKHIIELAQALAWPLVALYALAYFRRPLRSALELLPEKLRGVSKLTVGSLSFEIQAYLQATGDEELLRVLPKVSRRSFEKLLDLRATNHFYSLCVRGTNIRVEGETFSLRDQQELTSLREMESLGLIRFTEPLGEFEAFFEALPGYTPVQGSTDDGLVSIGLLTDAQRLRIESQRYVLTDLGRRAYDAVFTVVIRQIGQR